MLPAQVIILYWQHFLLRSFLRLIPIRMIVLGLDDTVSARRLVRLLLADPLSPREKWEDTLEGFGSDRSQGLLVR